VHPLLVQLSGTFDRLETRQEILDALSDLEEIYDGVDEIEQETVSRLIEELHRRLRQPAAGA
jgi:arginine repressor